MWTKNFKIKYKIQIYGAICTGENNEKYAFLPPQFYIGNKLFFCPQPWHTEMMLVSMNFVTLLGTWVKYAWGLELSMSWSWYSRRLLMWAKLTGRRHTDVQKLRKCNIFYLVFLQNFAIYYFLTQLTYLLWGVICNVSYSEFSSWWYNFLW